MKVCFLVSELSRSGGVAVVTQHAERLGREHGIEADLVVTSDEGSVAEALATEYDAAISTWWETAALLWRLKARRRIAFLQSAEECFYRGSEAADRLGAALSMRAADEYVVVSTWLAELVRGIRPGAAVTVVPNGIDKQVFDGSRVERDGPLRVLVEGQPSVWLKGVPDALAAVRAADAPIHLTVVSPTGSDGVNADRVLSEIEPEAMARIYGETDLVVKLSRLEGLGLVPLEAFHHGVPCVVTPYGGDADYVRHGENGFVAGFDDLQVVTRYVERLAGDGDLWPRLSEGALATAAEWPDTASSTELFAQALAGVAGTRGSRLRRGDSRRVAACRRTGPRLAQQLAGGHARRDARGARGPDRRNRAAERARGRARARPAPHRHPARGRAGDARLSRCRRRPIGCQPGSPVTDRLVLLADEDAAGLACAGSGFPVVEEARADGVSVSFSPDRPADVMWLSRAATDGGRVIAPSGEGLWRRAPWPAADDLFKWQPDGNGILVVGDDEVLLGRLRDEGADVVAADTLGPGDLGAAGVVVFPGAAGEPLPAEAPAVLAAGRILVTTPRSPDFGLRPGIDHCVGPSSGDLADLALSATGHPRAFESMRAYGRVAAERHRASRVLAALATDLELGL